MDKYANPVQRARLAPLSRLSNSLKEVGQYSAGIASRMKARILGRPVSPYLRSRKEATAHARYNAITKGFEEIQANNDSE
ncbi:MAG: hypothetical protein EOO22_06070 [Comamonadaceae bacterium]|nr:MAG: hypothetical protein EOO22_06070 [Comamonadaceae bacterium]